MYATELTATSIAPFVGASPEEEEPSHVRRRNDGEQAAPMLSDVALNCATVRDATFNSPRAVYTQMIPLPRQARSRRLTTPSTQFDQDGR